MHAAFIDADNLFFTQAFKDPVFFFSVIFTVVVSVVLHELGHGFAALGQGDDTAKRTGHLTLDPLVHMGAFSIIMLFVVGIAWGQTPVDPSRFRSRHGDAWVSFAGPLVNVGLALLALTGLALWIRFGGEPSGSVASNFSTFLFVFGLWNVVLFLFNMIPIPPLDGSNVVASFVPPFARMLRDPHNQGVFFALFIVVFISAPQIFQLAARIAEAWITVVAA
ncbi:MAG: site-2 protease family protein [Planctomycetota bacterium]|jgi:Zn-dependent protease